jgi:Putative archaeal flagellar protein G
MAEAVTEMIFFIVAVSLAAMVIGAVMVSIDKMNDAMGNTSNQIYDQMSTKIRIVNDPASMNSSPLIFYVQNIGRGDLNIDAVTLMIDNKPRGCDKYVLDNDFWGPSSILCLEIRHPRLPPGLHRVTIITENGTTEFMEFRIGP